MHYRLTMLLKGLESAVLMFFERSRPTYRTKNMFFKFFNGFRTKTRLWEPGSGKTDKISVWRNSGRKIRTKTSQNGKNRRGQKSPKTPNFVPGFNWNFQGSCDSTLLYKIRFTLPRERRMNRLEMDDALARIVVGERLWEVCVCVPST